MSLVYVFNKSSKLLFLFDGINFIIKSVNFQNTLHVRFLDRLHRLHIFQNRYPLQVRHPVCHANGQFASQKARNLHEDQLGGGVTIDRVRAKCFVKVLSASRPHQGLQRDAGLRLASAVVNDQEVVG